MAGTFSGYLNSTYTLTANPTTITSTGTINAGSPAATGILGTSGVAWTLTNLGTVESIGSNGIGVSLLSGGVVTNGASDVTAALIAGSFQAIGVNGSAGTIANFGTISQTGTAGTGVRLNAGGMVTNGAVGSTTALIEASNAGIVITGGAGTVANFGTVSVSGTNNPVYLNGGGIVTNGASNSTSALIAGNFSSPIYFNVVAGTVVNFGTLLQTGTEAGGGHGVNIRPGGVVTNEAGALISSYNNGIRATTGAATITNYGTIVTIGSTRGNGVYLGQGGTVTNQASGLITAYRIGVSVHNTAGTIDNFGTIQSTAPASFTAGFGIYLGRGGVITNEAGASITSLSRAISLGGTTSAAATVSNAGTITGSVGISINAADSGNNTIINFGTIIGTGGTAISFGGTGGSRLELAPGYSMSGSAIGSGTVGATNSLELLSGTATGTISGLGSKFANFGTDTVDAGAQWVLGGSNTIGAGVTLSNSGTLTVAGTLTDLGTLTNTGTLTGAGSLVVDPATLVNSGYIGLTVTLSGGGYLDNEATGTIAVAGNAVFGTLGAPAIVNAGTITGGTSGIGIDLLAGGSVDNTGTGLIEGYGGVLIRGAAGTVINSGTIASIGPATDITVVLSAGGTIVNSGAILNTGNYTVYFASGGFLSNSQSGYIGFGVFLNGVAGTVVNDGQILDTGDGNYGVNFLVGGSLGNTGLIAGSLKGVYLGGGSPGTVTNSGTIIGNALVGVDLASGGTVVDSGTISGGGGTAISFGGSGSNLLVVERGYNFSGGIVVGSGAATNTLELGSAAGAGTISAALSTEFVNFGTVTVDAGAQWSLTGSSSLSGITLTDLGTLTNTGTLTGTGSLVVDPATLINSGYIGLTVTLSGGSYLDNEATGTIAVAGNAVYGTFGAATVVNQGTILGTGTLGIGVDLVAGGSVDNTTTAGLVQGYIDGVKITGGAGTVTNFGTIKSTTTTSGAGVYLGGGGTITNEAGATIVGVRPGIAVIGTAATIANYGTIENTGTSTAIYSRAGGVITNAVGGTIEGTTAIVFRDTVGTTVSFGSVVNSGTIRGTGTTAGSGMYFQQGGVVTNAAGATITSPRTAISFNDTAGTIVSFGSVDNSGTIESTGITTGSGIYFGQGGILTNEAGATIAAVRNAINIGLTAATIANYGTIKSSGTNSTIYSRGGGVITNHGVIEHGGSAANAVSITGSAGRIANYGAISATNSGTAGTIGGSGIFLGAGGTITNLGTVSAPAANNGFGVDFGLGGGELVNGTLGSTAGLVTAYHIGVGFFPGTTGTPGTVTVVNYGTIQSTQTGTAGGTGFSGAGVQMGTSATGVVTNFGTISAAQTSGGWAILMQTGGTVTNSAPGLITAPFQAISISGSAGTVVNSGTISQTGTAGFNAISLAAGGTIDNLGTISSATTSGTGVSLGAGGGTVINSGLITTAYGSFETGVGAGLAATVINSGTIHAFGTSSGLGVGINSGSVSNSGLISGNSTGISAGPGAVTVSNSGTISAIKTGGTAFVTGVALGGSGTIINGTAGSTAGLITGYDVGISAFGTAVTATVVNYGTIKSTQPGTVVANGFTFAGFGVQMGTSATGVVSNFGTISAAQTSGGGAILMQTGGTVTNSASGLITAPAQAIGISGSAGTIVNSGTISQTGTAGINAINLAAGGTIDNLGTISSAATSGTGVSLGSGGGTVINSGLITTAYGLNETGVGAGTGGTVINSGTIHAFGTSSGLGVGINSGSVKNSGLISGNSTGINAGPGVVTVSNTGTISAIKTGGTAFVTGVALGGGGTIINGTTGGSTSGLITGYDIGISAFGTAVTATVVNYGTIKSTQPGTVVANGFTFFGFGVQMGTSATGVVSNFGTISAAQTNGGGAILLQGGGSVTNSASGLITAPAQGVNISGSVGTVVNFGTISQTGTTGFGAIFLGAGGTVIDSGTISAASGAAVGFGGTGGNLLVLEHGYKLFGGVFGSGTIGATNTLELAGSVGAAVTVGYNALGLTNFQDVLFGAGGNDTLKVTNTSGTLPIKISGFTLTSDIIDLTGIGTNGTITGNDTISHTVTVTGSLGSVTLLLDASDGTSFTTAPDGTGTDLIACFRRGTLILTPEGEVAVEDLAVGDLVETISGEARPIKWIGRRAYDGRFVAGNRAVLPIRIEAGAIARFVPSSDLWVSPEHALFIDGFLVPAAQLVNEASIIQAESVERLEYFHIELDEHDIIFAEGMPAETFVDCDNRLMFQNAGEYAALYPDEESAGWQFCAKRLSAGAPELAEIRETLWARAEALGYELTDDPDPHLVIAGEIVPAQSVVGAVCRFDVAAGAEAIWLGSRSVVPAEIDAGSQDGRRLGACIERIRLYDADLCVEVGHAHYGLCDGFHEAEATHRWTNGMARLPDALLRPFAGDLTVEVHLIPGELRYPLRAPEFSSPLGVAAQA